MVLVAVVACRGNALNIHLSIREKERLKTKYIIQQNHTYLLVLYVRFSGLINIHITKFIIKGVKKSVVIYKRSKRAYERIKNIEKKTR